MLSKPGLLSKAQRKEIGVLHRETEADGFAGECAHVIAAFPLHDARDVVAVDRQAVCNVETIARLQFRGKKAPADSRRPHPTSNIQRPTLNIQWSAPESARFIGFGRWTFIVGCFLRPHL